MLLTRSSLPCLLANENEIVLSIAEQLLASGATPSTSWAWPIWSGKPAMIASSYVVPGGGWTTVTVRLYGEYTSCRQRTTCLHSSLAAAPHAASNSSYSVILDAVPFGVDSVPGIDDVCLRASLLPRRTVQPPVQRLR